MLVREVVGDTNKERIYLLPNQCSLENYTTMNNQKGLYLLRENNINFYVNCNSRVEANFSAEMYNAQVLAGPIDKKFQKINPKTLIVVKGKVTVEHVE